MKRPSVLLVTYAGYLATSNTFIADNSLATLAASLLARGIETRILDFQNAEDIGSIGDLAGEQLAAELLARLQRQGSVDAATYRAYRQSRDLAQRAREIVFRERLLAAIAEQRPTLVGFKLWAGNGLPAMLEMAAAVRREHPEITLVAGGPAATLGGQRLRERAPMFDHFVVGDGEQAIVELALGAPAETIVTLGRRARRGGGVAYGTPLDALPPAVYTRDVYPGLDRFFSIRVIDESRGCFNHCAFCAHPSLSGTTRLKSPARVADEMQHALEQHGIETFRFSGSNPPFKHLCAVASEIRRRALPVRFSSFSSLANTRSERMQELAASGLRALFFGVESADPDVLSRAHHKNNLDERHVIEVVHAATDAGIFCCLSAIVPSPFETEAARARTRDLVCTSLEGGRLGAVLLLPALLMPGSDWWQRPEEFGFELTPGTTGDTLMDALLEWDNDFMLPRELAKEVGYSLHGRSSRELFEECGAFVRELQSAGIQTNVDDASFMIGQLAGLDAASYQRTMLDNMVLGGSARLGGFVRRMNAGTNLIGVKRELDKAS